MEETHTAHVFCLLHSSTRTPLLSFPSPQRHPSGGVLRIKFAIFQFRPPPVRKSFQG